LGRRSRDSRPQVSTPSRPGRRPVPFHRAASGSVFPSIGRGTAQLPKYYQFYAEFDQTKLGPEQGGRTFTDFGLQKLLGPSFELDAEYGVSFTPVNGSTFNYLGVGAGIRVR